MIKDVNEHGEPLTLKGPWTFNFKKTLPLKTHGFCLACRIKR